MNYTQTIKRALQITWRYKVLWIFGILLALTGGGGGGGGGGGSGSYGPGRDGDNPFRGLNMNSLGLDRIDWGAVAGVVALCCCLFLILAVIGVIVHYVARVALYRSVDQIEETGTAPTWRQGFRLGWSSRAFRIWLLDLIVGIPFAIIAILLLLLGAAPLLLLLVKSEAATALGIIFTVGLELLIILLLIIASVIVSVLGQFWAREIALADRSIGQALTLGYALAKSRAKDAGIMWLLTFGLGLIYGIASILLVIMLVLFGGVAGAGLGYAVYAATQTVWLGVLVGLPIFLVILVIPLAFVEGLWQVFESVTWTLIYRAVSRTPVAPVDDVPQAVG